MPRRRVTKLNSRQTPKTTSSTGDDNLTKDQRRMKLDIILKDFDDHVKKTLANLNRMTDEICKRLHTYYTMERTYLPAHIRDIKVSDFFALGGTLQTVQENLSEENDVAQKSAITSVVTMSARKPRTAVKRQQITTDSEESFTDSNTITKNTRQKRARTAAVPLSNSKRRKSSKKMPPPSTVRTRRNRQFETPALQSGPSMAGWETPAVTPKFDPRLPITPRTGRAPKAGETYMSLAGSPILSDESKELELKIPVGNKVHTINRFSKLNHTLLNVDMETRNNLLFLQQQLSTILGNGKK